MIKQTIIAALAATAAVAGVAFAQQSAPSDAPASAQAQQRPEADDQSREERGPRWRREFREDRAERGDRRGYDERERRGPPGGMMRGPGMEMGFCSSQGGRFSEAMLERIERATRPTEQQKPLFDKLKEAATKAAETAKAGCPTEMSVTPPGRLADAEKRLTAMIEAIRTVRPAMDAYYSSLSDEQKARLYLSRRTMMDRGMGPDMGPMRDRRDGWRGPERGEPRDNYRNPDREGSRERRFDRRPDRDDDRDQRGRSDRTESESDSDSDSEQL